MSRIEAPWAKIPLHVAADDSLVLGDIRVYVALDYLAGKRGHWYGSQEQIAAIAGTSTDTVLRAVGKLRERDYISTAKMGLEKRNVLRYMIHARTVDADDFAATRVDAGEPTAPVRETVNRTDAVGKDTDLPQTTNTEVDLSSPARASIRWYEQTTGHRARNGTLRQILADIGDTHPPECLRWAWETAAGMDKPWPYAQRMFQGCAMQPHGPRGSNGAYKPGDRGGHGRGERGAAGADRERSRPLTEAERVAAIAELERVDQEIRAAGATAGAVE